MSAKPKINIDRLAASAMKPAAAPPSVLNAGLSMQCANWSVLIHPREPKEESAGGIVLTDETQQAEGIRACIGQIVGLGPTALHGKTPSGIEICQVGYDANFAGVLLGKWVIHHKYAGMEVYNTRLKAKLRIMTISDVLMLVSDPDEWSFDPV